MVRKPTTVCQTLSSAALKRFLADKVAPFEMPTLVHFCEALPTDPFGKHMPLQLLKEYCSGALTLLE